MMKMLKKMMFKKMMKNMMKGHKMHFDHDDDDDDESGPEGYFRGVDDDEAGFEDFMKALFKSTTQATQALRRNKRATDADLLDIGDKLVEKLKMEQDKMKY